MSGKFYTGVGSRETPEDVLHVMYEAAAWLSGQGWVLRSGGARGVDKAFENGCDSVLGFKEIYYADDCTEACQDVARTFHPAWNRLSGYAKKLHGRNALQVLGRNLATHSKFILCWTPDGVIDHFSRSRETGGTGTAISIASINGIPVYNLQRPDHLDRVLRKVG